MHLTCTHHDTDTTPVSDTLDDAGIIPFADEVAPAPVKAKKTKTITARRDSALEAFGPVHKRVSVADRELGIERNKWERRGKYSCPCCTQKTSRVMRVHVAHRPGWSAVCAVCAATLLAKVPGTIVGGMVRPSRRRKTRVAGQTTHGFRRVGQDGYRRAG